MVGKNNLWLIWLAFPFVPTNISKIIKRLNYIFQPKICLIKKIKICYHTFKINTLENVFETFYCTCGTAKLREITVGDHTIIFINNMASWNTTYTTYDDNSVTFSKKSSLRRYTLRITCMCVFWILDVTDRFANQRPDRNSQLKRKE